MVDKHPKRPRNVIGNAVRVMEVATGQREEEAEDKAASAPDKKRDKAKKG